LDEIPQLLNVLNGDMSIVGPRPEREEFIRKLEKKIPIYALRLFTKPGITGWAQVAHGYAATLADLEEKFCYDLYYLKHMTLSLDVKIILMTVQHFLFARGR
jgi:lipopolysaccharide/colanic/teichoic acid biosynthesis glycosyltransferase